MMTRLLPCFTVAAVATATATTTRVTMDDEPAFFAAALARDDAAARWRAEASAANVRALGVAPGRVVLLFAAPALSEEARALAALGYRVEAYHLVGDAAADVELRLFDRFLEDLGPGERVVFFRPGGAFTRLPGSVGALVAPPTPYACDAALYADEPKLMHNYTRGDGGVVYEYYARENAQSEMVCGARCFVRAPYR